MAQGMEKKVGSHLDQCLRSPIPFWKSILRTVSLGQFLSASIKECSYTSQDSYHITRQYNVWDHHCTCHLLLVEMSLWHMTILYLALKGQTT